MAVVNTLQLVDGTFSGGDVVDAGGEFVVFNGGIISATVITNPSFNNFPATLSAGAFVNSGGTADDTSVLGGGEQVVDSTGSAVNTLIAQNGTELVFSGGVTSSPQVLLEGTEDIAVGGMALFALVNGGDLNVGSGGKDINATIGAQPGSFEGGEVTVSAGGLDTGATVALGGFLTVLPGGTASGVTITGGEVGVAAGGTIDAVIVSGGPEFTGTLELEAGATVSGAVELLRGGAVFLETDSLPGLILKDFKGEDFVDFQLVKFFGHGPQVTTVIWDQTSNREGVLKVDEGHRSVANVKLLGQYVTSDFQTQDGSEGGTDVVFNPAASQAGASAALASPHHGSLSSELHFFAPSH